MHGRENKKSNDLFYTCSLIEYIARRTHNNPTAIVNALGKERIDKIYSLADVYHSDNIDSVADGFIAECNIQPGTFDNVSKCKYSIPSHWDIGKVYKRLILGESAQTGADVIDMAMNVYRSDIVSLIEDYNSSFYYDSPNVILDTYENNCIPL